MVSCYRYRRDDNVILFLRFSKDEGPFIEYITDESIGKLENDLVKIFENIHEYGIKAMGVDNSIEALQAKKEDFIEKVHEGLEIAQDDLIERILEINSKAEGLKIQLKQANIDRNKDLVKALNLKLRDLSNREHMFRKLADTIAWGYIVRDHPTARRLYIGRPLDSIQNSDIENYRKFSDDFNKNKQNFCLLTDITSFIQLGDAICIEIDAKGFQKWYLVEFKSGKTNYKILSILSNKEPLTEDVKKSLTRKEVEQGLRIMKQHKRVDSAYSIIETGNGIDETGKHVHITDLEDIEFDYYYDIVRQLLKDCEENGWSIKVVDDCLYIGVYNTDVPIKKAYEAFGSWMIAEKVVYPITNFQSIFHCPLCKPLFLNEIEKKDLIDITLGRKIILMSLDFETWFDLGEDIGLHCEWLTRKESENYIKENKMANSTYTHDHKIIKMSNGTNSSIMGDAIPARIFFEFLRPTSAMKMMKEGFVRNPSMKFHI